MQIQMKSLSFNFFIYGCKCTTSFETNNSFPDFFYFKGNISIQ